MERDLLKRTVAFWVKETSTPVVAGSDVRVDAGEGAGHACQNADQRQDDASRSSAVVCLPSSRWLYPSSRSSWLVSGVENGMVRVAVRPRTLQPWPGFTVMPSGNATSSVNLAGLAMGCGSVVIS
jgi:hypothetical protein